MCKLFMQTLWFMLNSTLPSGVWNPAVCKVEGAHQCGPWAPGLQGASVETAPYMCSRRIGGGIRPRVTPLGGLLEVHAWFPGLLLPCLLSLKL